ncbi:cytochrome c family protein [Beijerinckia sp. L45]|uniref:c-type cytochrome n=1 Tax=Beijerinckia sp. L45 TaxID=1641855 RepID=UPI00131B49F8|nr:c-type cytochrome [Beijerinckia sp. L45]
MRPQSNRRRVLSAWSASAAVAILLFVAACSADDKEARRRAAGPAPTQAALAKVASVSAGAGIFTRCAVCHPIQRGASDRDGPNLFGVMGNAIAQNSPRFGYTAALRQVGGTWTRARMDIWLTNPKAFVSGTTMGFAGLPDPLDRADVIAYLETQRRSGP